MPCGVMDSGQCGGRAAAKHPAAQQQEPHHGGEQVRDHQHGDLHQVARLRGHPVQHHQRSAGDRQSQQEHAEALELMPDNVFAPAHTEGQPPVGRGVGDRGDRQRQEVGDLRAGDRPQHDEQHQVGQCADHADRCEPDDLPGHPDRNSRRRRIQRCPPQLPADLGERQFAGRQRPAHPGDALEVVLRGLHDVDPGIGVVHPVDRDLVDPQSAALGQDQQLGVEEPAGVLHQRQQLPGDIGADGLEPALGVGEPGRQSAPQQQVVAPGDELPLGSSDDPAAPVQPGPDRHIRVPGDQRGDQRKEGGQIGGQVDVHVGQHGRVGLAPDEVQRPSAALFGKVHGRHRRKFVGQPVGDLRGPVRGGVVGDGDAEGQRHAGSTDSRAVGARPVPGRSARCTRERQRPARRSPGNRMSWPAVDRSRRRRCSGGCPRS